MSIRLFFSLLSLFCFVLLGPVVATNPSWSASRRRTFGAHSASSLEDFRSVRHKSLSLVARADNDTASELQTLFARRNARVVGSIYNAGNISDWITSLDSEGKWPDNEIDYTTQCQAQRANWPAYIHWQRIVTLASGYYGGVPGGSNWAANEELRDATSKAMDWWFQRDFTNPLCQDQAGKDGCPCGGDTPTEWLFNTNWFSNIILIPRLVGQTCLLLNDTLSQSQKSNCTNITTRSYANFFHDISGVSGGLTGANALDVAGIGLDGGILSNNLTQIANAYDRVHAELVISPIQDGIQKDGSFGQHGGLLYNGNYGKDFSNDVLGMEIAAAGTRFAAQDDGKKALETLFDGNRWMIYRNKFTNVLHWDLSPLVRMISFPVNDERQPTSSILTNLTEVKQLGELWKSETLLNFAEDVLPNNSAPNAGQTVGHKHFWSNDYSVHRGEQFVITLKMFSARTKNTECTNSQNPLGFHLGDGALYTYVDGNDYEDVAQSWDWELIPGTTTDIGGTPLNCTNTNLNGLSSIVGGASNDIIGVAAMQYTNPVTQAFGWNKAWFFLADGVQHVLVTNITSSSDKQIVSVLEQKRSSGNAESQEIEAGNALWHGGVGYLLPKNSDNFTLQYVAETKQGNWSAIGTSKVDPTSVDVFKAYVQHNNMHAPLEYTMYPATDSFDAFVEKSRKRPLHTLLNGPSTAAVYDEKERTLFFTVWDLIGASLTLTPPGQEEPLIFSANSAVVGFVNLNSGELVIADPTQKATTLEVSISKGNSTGGQTITLPTGQEAGKSVTQNIYSS